MTSYLHFQNAELKEEMNERDKRLKQMEDRLCMSIQEKTKSEEKLELLLEELQNIDLSTPTNTLTRLDSSPSVKRKTLHKSSPFSFLLNAHSSRYTGRSSLRFRKSNKGSKNGSSETEKSRVTSVGDREASVEASNANNNSTNAMNGSLDTEEADGDGSKACVVM